MRTRQGHSSDRWEGDVLVVETTLFADHRVGNSFGSAFATGLPSGPQKRVVERYRLSDDRTRMLIDFVVEAPSTSRRRSRPARSGTMRPSSGSRDSAARRTRRDALRFVRDGSAVAGMIGRAGLILEYAEQ